MSTAGPDPAISFKKMTIFVNKKKKKSSFGHFLTFNWQFSGGSELDQWSNILRIYKNEDSGYELHLGVPLLLCKYRFSCLDIGIQFGNLVT